MVTRSWEELGVSREGLDEAVNSLREDRPFSMRGKIDPVTGQFARGKTGVGGVPLIEAGTLKGGYSEFFEQMPDHMKRTSLGARRYEMWQRGEIGLDELADANGRQRTLAELQQLRRGKGAVPSGGTGVPSSSASDDPVARRFVNKENGELFLRKKQEYRAFFDEYSDEDIELIRKYASVDFADRPALMTKEQQNYLEDIQEQFIDRFMDDSEFGYHSITDWQNSTHKRNPMLFKRAVSEMEDVGEMAYFEDISSRDLDWIREASLPEDKVVNLRAFNQAYMERVGIQEEKLYRGIDKGSGKQIADEIISEKDVSSEWSIKESPLAGFSSNKNIADKFGAKSKEGGITYEINVPKEEIVVHRDLLSGLTGRHGSEQEFIIVGGERNIKPEQIETYK